jgi:uncharacterized protein (TIGR03435 family)
MMRAILLGLCAAAAIAQTTEGPTFEVASIKPAAPQGPGKVMMGRSGGPGSRDPGQVTYFNATLKMLLQDAYNVKSFQISGPGWLDTVPFDVSAKIAPGTTQEQFRVMIQNLLKDRFKMVVHQETKELPVFALVPAKGGPKLKESAEDPPAPEGGPDSGPAPGPAMIRDGKLVMPKGGRGGMMMNISNGRLHMMANKVEMGRLCDMLGQQLSRPVLDETGLKGTYDIDLQFTPEPGTGPAAKMGVMMGHPPGGEGGVMSDQEASPTLFAALQEQLGLKLEQKKGPVALIVVDKGEKVPTEN